MSAREVGKRLEKLRMMIEHACNQAADEVANAVLEAATELVPVQTGELRDSGSVIKATDGVATVQYDAPHALPVHERSDGQGFKFLERAAGSVDVKSIATDSLKRSIKEAV
jgi:hypothetical protein